MNTQLRTLLAQDPLGGDLPFKAPGAFQPTLVAGAAAGGTPFERFFSVLFGFFTIIGGLMFLLYFIMGALSWLSAGGEKGKVEAARTQLTNAAIGMIILVLSQSVVGIASGVLGLKILSPLAALTGLWPASP